jgi:hypothetical protein
MLLLNSSESFVCYAGSPNRFGFHHSRFGLEKSGRVRMFWLHLIDRGKWRNLRLPKRRDLGRENIRPFLSWRRAGFVCDFEDDEFGWFEWRKPYHDVDKTCRLVGGGCGLSPAFHKIGILRFGPLKSPLPK